MTHDEGASDAGAGGGDDDRHLTALDLDWLALDRAEPASARARAASHAARCARCAARAREHHRLHQRFHADIFPRTSEALAARGWSRRRARARRWALALALPAMAAALLLVRARPRGDGAPPAIGVKGHALFEAFVRRGGGDGAAVVRLEEGARLAPGDALRFVLYPAGLPHALIVSVDGAGAISIYFPFHGTGSATVDPRAPHAVPGSIVLDRAPGPERLFVVYSDRAIDADTIRGALAPTAAGGAAAIRAGRRLPLDGVMQATLLFEKEEPAR